MRSFMIALKRLYLPRHNVFKHTKGRAKQARNITCTYELSLILKYSVTKKKNKYRGKISHNIDEQTN